MVGRLSTFGETYDLGGPDVLRYRDMMQIVGAELGIPRKTLRVPFMSPRLSSLWVSVVTGAPRTLVKPLVESLHHDMVCRDRRLQEAAGLPGLSFRESVRATLAATAASSREEPQAYEPAPPAPLVGVRSVQRISLPGGRDAEWAAQEYMRWLPHGAWPMRVEIATDPRVTKFFVRPFRRSLLELELETSASDLQVFSVTGGWLTRSRTRGRLEFRVTLDGTQLVTAIHDFVPRLPWWLYRSSQALVHRFVMWRFGRHLARMPADPANPPAKPRAAEGPSSRARPPSSEAEGRARRSDADPREAAMGDPHRVTNHRSW